VRRSAKGGGEEGSKEELGLSQTAALGEVSAPGFSRWEQDMVGHGSPVGEAQRLVLFRPTGQQVPLGDPS